MKTVQRKGLNFEGQNVYIGIDVHKKILLSGKHFEKEKKWAGFRKRNPAFLVYICFDKKNKKRWSKVHILSDSRCMVC